MGLFSWRHTWKVLFAMESVYIEDHKNTNASNFILYSGPDSSPKGPRVAHNWFIQLKTYIDNSFCNGICIHRGSQKYHCQQLYLYRGPDSRRRGPHQNGFIQLKTYMDNSFCNGICIHWEQQNTNASNFILYIGLDSSPKGPGCPTTDLFSWRHTRIVFLQWNLYTLGLTKLPMPATLSCTLAQTAAPKGPEVPLLIYSAEDIHE